MPDLPLPLDQVLQGDCLDLLPTLPAASVDLVFADPPYNLQLRQELYRPNRSRVDAVDDAWDRFGSFQAYDDFSRQWLTACRRVLKDTGAIWVIGTYHNIFRLGAILQDLGYWILNSVVWVKTNPMPNFRGVRFTNAHETLIWASVRKGARYTFNHHTMKNLNDDLQMRSDWVIPLCTGEERIKDPSGRKAHSTQKPEALLYRVLLASTRSGDVVLDPFFGSGTTGAVAKKLGRRWIGIEREPRYVEVARQRLAAIPPALPGDFFPTERPTRGAAARLPFGRLLESGLLQPGQALYFRQDRAQAARLRPDGHLELDGAEGSIHGLAARLLGGPANGWELWFYEAEDGALHCINELRQRLRA
jgi:DNA modification methylase